MDFRQVLSVCFYVLSKVRLPSGKPPPEADVVEIYKKCRARVDEQITQQVTAPPVSFAASPSPSLGLPGPEPLAFLPEANASQNISTACVPCLRGHISAVSGALTEAERMSRGDGIATPEVADRIRLAQDEITIAERKDLAPEAILRAPKAEQGIIEEFLPRIRQLRQHITTISSRDDLLHVAAEANIMGRDLTLRHLESKGIDPGKVVDIANQVSNGELTLEDAKKRVEELVKV